MPPLLRSSVLIGLLSLFLSTHASAQALNCNSIDTLLVEGTTQHCEETKPADTAKPTVDVDESPRGTHRGIPDTIWRAMRGKSWHPNRGCPSRRKLRLLTIPHWDYSATRTTGQLIVARDVADEILDVFAQLYKDEFLIQRMQLVSTFKGSDRRSMAANNTSAFNCRLKFSKSGLSEHAYGRAIDINPVQNPYVSRRSIQPSAGRTYRSRKSRKHKGMILRNDKVVRAFRKIGWKWGGNWRSAKDYQHFSKTGK